MTIENLKLFTSNYSYIFFDLDDTIYPISDYDKGAFKNICNKLFSASNIEIGYEWLLNNKYGILGDRLFLNFLKHFHLPLDLENVCTKMYQSYNCDTLSKNNSLYQFVYDLKKQGKFLFLLTNGNYKRQERKIQALGLSEIFDGIAIGDPQVSNDLMKPNIDIAKHFGINTNKNKCLMIGDNEYIDGGFARNVKIDFVKFKFPI